MSNEHTIPEPDPVRVLQNTALVLAGEIELLHSSLSNRFGHPRPQTGQQACLALVVHSLRQRLAVKREIAREVETKLSLAHERPVQLGRFAGPTAAGLAVRIADELQLSVHRSVMQDEVIQAHFKTNPRIQDDRETLGTSEFDQVILCSQSPIDAIQHIEESFSPVWRELSIQLRVEPDFSTYYANILFPRVRDQLLRELDGFDGEALRAEINLEFNKYRERLPRSSEPPVELSRCETLCVAVIRAAGRRLTTDQILDALTSYPKAPTEASVKPALAVLCRFGILSNRTDVRPRGYGLPEWDVD